MIRHLSSLGYLLIISVALNHLLISMQHGEDAHRYANRTGAAVFSGHEPAAPGWLPLHPPRFHVHYKPT